MMRELGNWLIVTSLLLIVIGGSMMIAVRLQ